MNYYKILGLDRTATIQEIEDAYKRMLSLYGTDSNDSSFAVRICAHFTEAYEVLKNPIQREMYDHSLGDIEKTATSDEVDDPRLGGVCIRMEETERVQRSGNDPAFREYLFRWKVPAAVGGSFFLIRCLSLQLFLDPPAARSYLSWATVFFVLGGWIVVWIARFSALVEKLMNRRIDSENKYIKSELKYFDRKTLGVLASFGCATAYGFFLYLSAPYDLDSFTYGRTGNTAPEIWPFIYFGVFHIAYLFLEKDGVYRNLVKELAYWAKLRKS